mgnify:CR=1 FL=1
MNTTSPSHPLARSRGFSLIEMLLVLGVLAILLVAAFVVYPRVQLSNQINQEKANLSMLQNGIRSTLAPQGGKYTVLGAQGQTIGNRFANQARLVPSSMNGGDYQGSTITNGWGGAVVIHSTTGTFEGYAPGRSFGIQYNNVPQEACADFVMRTLGGFSAAWVNGATGAGTYLTPANITPDRVVARCQLQNPTTIHFVSN